MFETAVRVARRTKDGSFERINLANCSFCNRQSEVIASSPVIRQLFLKANSVPINICKTCCSEAIELIDKKMLEE